MKQTTDNEVLMDITESSAYMFFPISSMDVVDPE